MNLKLTERQDIIRWVHTKDQSALECQVHLNTLKTTAINDNE